MARYSGAPVYWRIITTTRKGGEVTQQWQATVRYQDGDGRTRRKSKLYPADAKLDTERQRKAAARKWLADLDSAEEAMQVVTEEAMQAGAADPYATVTVGDYVSQFVEGLVTAGDIERSTAKSYRGAVNHIREGFPGILLRDLNAATVKEWRDYLLGIDYAPSSVTKWLRVLSEAMREAVNLDIIEKNPCNAVRAPKRTPPKPNSLTAEGYARLAQTLYVLEPSPVVVAASIAMHCGLRVGEVCGIRWREYDAEARIIHVVEAIGADGTGRDYAKVPKTLAGVRDVPVPDMLADILDRRRDLMTKELEEVGITYDAEEFGTLYVCGDAYTGRFASPTVIERQFKGLAESFGLVGSRGRRMTMHGLRDTYATLAIGVGADVRSVAGVLGHSNPAITLTVYADALPEGKRRTSDLLATIATRQGVKPYEELAEPEGGKVG